MKWRDRALLARAAESEAANDPNRGRFGKNATPGTPRSPKPKPGRRR